MSKPTPGPWKVLPLAYKYYGTRIDIGGTVVEVWSNKSWQPSPREEQDPEVRDSGHFENDVDYADARLIAAAPDLLAALNQLLTRYTELVNCGDCGNWNPETELEVKDARAAIRKAQGALRL